MREVVLVVGGAVVRCSVDRQQDQFVVRVNGITHHLHLLDAEHGLFHLSSAGRAQIVRTARGETRNFLHIDGHTLEYQRSATAGAPGSGSRAVTPDILAAPMPGAVTQVLVKTGDRVVRGQPLVIIEAMKMEHVIRAHRAGSIRAVHARAGDQIDGGVGVVEMMENVDEAPR
ncbi:MAG TPA: biotin/lipoyl-containing protein [bacterium]|nr:biotin/lipoyl-containing protein [bacterium]